MKGRKPKPTKLKVLGGNPGKRPLNTQEPKPKSGRPMCPKHLSPEARKAWRKLAKELEAVGLLSKLDGIALEMVCETYARWQDANEKVQKTGLMLKSPNGFPVINPCLSIANRCFDQLKSMLSEFGLSPAERSRLKIEKPTEEDELEAFMKMGRGSK